MNLTEMQQKILILEENLKLTAEEVKAKSKGEYSINPNPKK